MDNKIKLVIIALVIVLIVFSLGLWGFKIIKHKRAAEVEVILKEETSKEPPSNLPLINTVIEHDSVVEILPSQEDLKVKTQAYITQLTMTFVERFGSFSNQNNFQNLKDLKVLMTTKMQQWVDDFIVNAQKQSQTNQSYFGITTKAISLQSLELEIEKGYAKFKISSQRSETSAQFVEPKVYYQDILVDLVKVGDEWKFDSAKWL